MAYLLKTLCPGLVRLATTAPRKHAQYPVCRRVGLHLESRDGEKSKTTITCPSDFATNHYQGGYTVKFRSAFIAAGIAVALLGGCRSAAVYNVDAAPVTANKAVTMADMQKAIIRAGAGLGWQMKVVQPGLIVGTLRLRSHMAAVDIKYDTKAYSISYKDSSNLDYDGTNIHKNYNGWIQNLDNAIRVQVANL